MKTKYTLTVSTEIKRVRNSQELLIVSRCGNLYKNRGFGSLLFWNICHSPSKFIPKSVCAQTICKKPKSYITDSADLSTKKKTEHEGLVSKGCQEKAPSLQKERDSTAYCEHGGGRLMMWVYFGAT